MTETTPVGSGGFARIVRTAWCHVYRALTWRLVPRNTQGRMITAVFVLILCLRCFRSSGICGH